MHYERYGCGHQPDNGPCAGKGLASGGPTFDTPTLTAYGDCRCDERHRDYR